MQVVDEQASDRGKVIDTPVFGQEKRNKTMKFIQITDRSKSPNIFAVKRKSKRESTMTSIASKDLDSSRSVPRSVRPF